MQKIHKDYNEYSILFKNLKGSPTCEFCELFSFPTKEISKDYLKILKGYDKDIMKHEYIDIWVVNTKESKFNVSDIINDIKIINADRKDFD